MPVRRDSTDFNSAQDSFNAAQSSFQTTSTVISVGAIVGIVVSVVAFISIGIAIACVLSKRSKRRAAMIQPTYATGYANTTYGPPPMAAPGQTYPSPPPQSYQTYDQTYAKGQPLETELTGSHVYPNHELAGSQVQPPVHEMPNHGSKDPHAMSV